MLTWFNNKCIQRNSNVGIFLQSNQRRVLSNVFIAVIVNKQITMMTKYANMSANRRVLPRETKFYNLEKANQ